MRVLKQRLSSGLGDHCRYPDGLNYGLMSTDSTKSKRTLLQQLAGAIVGLAVGGITAVISVYFLATTMPRNKDLIGVIFLVSLGLGMCVGVLTMRAIARRQAGGNRSIRKS